MFTHIHYPSKFILLVRHVNKNFSFAPSSSLKSIHTNFCSAQRTVPLLCIKQNDFYNVMNNKRMAGHAKWQNVKHVKAEKDRQKNIMCNKYVFLIGLAVRGKIVNFKLH